MIFGFKFQILGKTIEELGCPRRKPHVSFTKISFKIEFQEG
jgi:hypothetical protein